MKICKDCKIEKDVKDFPRRTNYNGTGTLYRQSYCKKCWVIRAKAWQNKNKERYAKWLSDYYKSKKLEMWKS